MEDTITPSIQYRTVWIFDILLIYVLSTTISLLSSSNILLFVAKKGKFHGVLQKFELQSTRIINFWAFLFYFNLGLKNFFIYSFLVL